MMAKQRLGSIVFSAPSARAVWIAEILGQLSDGMWENARPHDHWEFWHALEPKCDAGPDRVEFAVGHRYAGVGQRTGYNFAALLPVIGARMLAYGRMGRAAGPSADSAPLEAAEYLADIGENKYFEMLNGSRPATTYAEKKAFDVAPDLAEKFFRASYTEKDLKADLKRIKAAMKSAARA